jgi:hypothetical protein
MIIDDKAKAALKQPDTRSVQMEMTPERKARFSRVGGQVVDLLKANTDGPLEAYMLLQMVMHGFEDAYGIRGGIVMENKDEKH